MIVTGSEMVRNFYPFVKKPKKAEEQNDDQIIDDEGFGFFLHYR